MGCDVWGGVGGIGKTVCAVCLEFRIFVYLSGTPVHSARPVDTNWFFMQQQITLCLRMAVG
jgi:hypothetical protein